MIDEDIYTAGCRSKCAIEPYGEGYAHQPETVKRLESGTM